MQLAASASCHHVAVEILPAAALPEEALAVLARALVATFGHAYPQWSAEEAQAELGNAQGLPTSHFAMQNAQVMGCASLLADDEVSGYEGQGPWLGNVWIHEEYRERGVGSALVRSISELAASQGATALYLVTDTATAWYAKQGWTELGSALVHGHAMTVMRMQL